MRWRWGRTGRSTLPRRRGIVCQFSTRGRICGGRRTFCTRYRRTRRRGRGEGGRQKAEGIHHRGTEGTEAGREEGGTRQAEEDEAGTFGVNRSLTLGKSKIAQRFSAGYTLIVDPSPVGTVGVLPSLRDLASVLS